MLYRTLKKARDTLFVLWSRTWRGVLRRLEALRNTITGAPLHWAALWGRGFAHLLCRSGSL